MDFCLDFVNKTSIDVDSAFRDEVSGRLIKDSNY